MFLIISKERCIDDFSFHLFSTYTWLAKTTCMLYSFRPLQCWWSLDSHIVTDGSSKRNPFYSRSGCCSLLSVIISVMACVNEFSASVWFLKSVFIVLHMKVIIWMDFVNHFWISPTLVLLLMYCIQHYAIAFSYWAVVSVMYRLQCKQGLGERMKINVVIMEVLIWSSSCMNMGAILFWLSRANNTSSYLLAIVQFQNVLFEANEKARQLILHRAFS